MISTFDIDIDIDIKIKIHININININDGNSAAPALTKFSGAGSEKFTLVEDALEVLVAYVNDRLFFVAHAVRARGSDGHQIVCSRATILKLLRQ